MRSFDHLQRFIFEHASIRGEIVHIGETYRTIMQQHPYPKAVKTLLGEALVSCLLLADSIKFKGDLSIQFQGDKRLPLLLVQCDDQLNVRACAQYQEANHINYTEAFAQGQMALTIKQSDKPQSYQSIVPISSSSMAENLMHYFAQSEQIPTKVWLAVDEENAAGMLLQLMPMQNSQQREQFWEYAVQIGETIKNHELLTLDNTTILHRLYHETEIRVFEERSIQFRCRCNREKMKQGILMLGEKDCQELLKENTLVEVNCDFCNQRYQFDPIDVAMIFK